MAGKESDSIITCTLPEKNTFGSATRQLITDLETYCRELGFNVEFYKSLSRSFLKGFLIRSHIIILPYPAILNTVITSSFQFIIKLITILILRFLYTVGRRIIIYVYDLPIEQNLFTWGNLKYEKLSRIIEKMLLDAVDVILVFNELMASYTSKYYGVRRDKFVLFEVLDYGADIKVSAQNRAFPMDDKSWVIAYATNFSNPKVRKTIKEFIMRCYEEDYGKVKLILVGKESSMILNTVTPNVIVFDELSPEKLEEKVYSQSHFGLVLKVSQYYEFGSTSKFSSYLHANLPVVVPEEYVYLSKLVKKYGVGIVFKDCKDLIDKLKVLTQEEYVKISISAKRLGIKIRQGYFFKKALFQALKLLYQRAK